ncbi:hypothetical protein E2C01_070060 [Portunus trituberculatus]|uniref:Uncharacterized protein n=1 Tax=Portunus trituberculatus TaxID=210409 RepID=A0A5B7I2J0_PORTR|nr:hypothetical protein [Portunus trituberculatus]
MAQVTRSSSSQEAIQGDLALFSETSPSNDVPSVTGGGNPRYTGPLLGL